jgi:hypothetical protein
MICIGPAFRTDLLLIIALAFGTFGCAGISSGRSGGGDGETSPPPSVQLWSEILDPSRATDWTQAGVQGGIPYYTTICQTVNPSGDTAGATDVTNINTALSTCAGLSSSTAPQVVLLNSGTFYANSNIGPPLASKYLVMRGKSPTNTIIKWVNTSASCGHSTGTDICFQGNVNTDVSYSTGGGGTTSWLGTNHVVGTYTQGATVVDLTSTSALAAGQILFLDQRDDSMGLCPQSGGTGNCFGHVGLSSRGATVTAITSAPYALITPGALVWIGTSNNHSMDGACGGYQSGPTAWTVVTATTTTTNTTFTYTDRNPLSEPTVNCQPALASVDTAGVFTSNLNGSTTLSNSASARRCPDATSGNQCASGEYSFRDLIEAHTISAVCTGSGAPVASCLAANEVVLDEPVMNPNFNTAQAPGAWWTGTWPAKYSEFIGIENLTVDASGDGGEAFSTIDYNNLTNSWVKNVRSLYTDQIHIDVANANHISIVDSYLFGTLANSSASYGLDFRANSSYGLAQNNIVQHVVSGIQNEGNEGSVISYNYAFDPGYAGSLGGMITTTPLNHGFTAALLFEGNDTNQCQTNVAHGSSFNLTYFRNRCRGQDIPVMTTTLFALVDVAFQRTQNVVANILGTVGSQSTYVQNGAIPPFPTQGLYWLNSSAGYIENGDGQFAFNDPLVATSLLRWGNYDVVTGATRWCGTGREGECDGTSEIPTTGVAFINGNAVPASHNLPPSFYLSAQPQFWTMASGYGPTPPWPAIGPDVSGGTAPDGVAGYSYAIPAQLCYINTPVDPSYQRILAVSAGTWSKGTGQEQATFQTRSSTLKVGDVVTISGVSPSSYNGIYQVISATSTSVTVFMPNDPGTYESGGIITYPNILNFNAANCYPNE